MGPHTLGPGYTPDIVTVLAAKAARRNALPDPSALAQAIVDILSDRQATDIALLDIAHVSTIADYFVIATGTSVRQLNALVDALDEGLREISARPRRVEGTAESGWILIDYGDVVVHLFGPEERRFYDLDGLWSRSVPVVRFQ
jgi:ribosome-associated protein